MPAKTVTISDGFLTIEERKAGYLLVEIGPKLRNLHGDPERSGIFHEAHEKHPNEQEALVTDKQVVRVWRSPLVAMALATGKLVESDKPETKRIKVRDTIDAELETRGQHNDEKDIEIARLRRQLADMQESARTNQPA